MVVIFGVWYTAHLQVLEQEKVNLNNEQFVEARKFLESLEDQDDVQKVYSNLEMME